ncbi:uncharacterized protein J4E78_003141 [Alternaria triticimaculans]|uniref:uncharacterized protein n=1 Tax=Alternaria triticimaculans TaxID=297637 RepID=UPI0020C4AA03|nr:uncharacterized protein J4E78_003141 [Alternaria triticimaculans]KAI4665678.1 hypothetical protein J4E78_003141 [Alternaria triticimaculans]
MRFITAVAFAATASFVAAQDKCDAQNIVDTCVQGYQGRIDDCNKNGNDFICLCDVYRDVLVCYNNCPDSLEKPPVQNTVTSYCGAAEPLRAAASSSMASVASVAATQSHAAASATSAMTSATGTGSESESAPSATASSFEGAGSSFGVPAGAAIVAMFAGLL